MILKTRLKDVLKARGITQKKLAEETGLRENTISEIVKNRRDTINREHIAIIANYLGITDLNEILYIENY